MKTSIRFRLNGRTTTLDTDDRRSLLWALRTDLGLTGAKYGCGQGDCGACTVIVAGRAVRSCVATLAGVKDREVTTVEGLADEENLHPLQQAFIDHGAFQCGYCTPGILMQAYALLQSKPSPSRDEIVAAMDRVLCRCGAHQRIIAAVQDAARRMGDRS